MTRTLKKKLAAFHYKLAELVFIGMVIGGVMQPNMPIGKVLLGFAFTFMTFVFAVGMDFLASQSKPP